MPHSAAPAFQIIAAFLYITAFAQAGEAAISKDLEPFEYAGLERSYHIHAPQDTGKPVPLVIVLHGALDNAFGAEILTGFSPKAEIEKFIVVYPNGTSADPGERYQFMWNGGNCCGPAEAMKVDDSGFILALIQKLQQVYLIDPRRIYVTGFSNGALLSYKLACEHSDVIAAIAPVSGSLEPECKPEQPVSVLAFHGTDDLKVLYEGGFSPVIYGSKYDTPVSFARDFWLRNNQCEAVMKSQEMPGWIREHSSECAAGTEVVFYTIKEGDHAWPRMSRDGLPATDLIWDFFKKHPKRS